jgi:hypothetical protein
LRSWVRGGWPHVPPWLEKFSVRVSPRWVYAEKLPDVTSHRRLGHDGSDALTGVAAWRQLADGWNSGSTKPSGMPVPIW